MARTEDLLLSSVVRGHQVRSALKLGVTRDLFLKRRPEWMWLEGHPDAGRAAFKGKFPDFKIYMADPEDLEELVATARQQRLDYELGQAFTRYQRQYNTVPSDQLIVKMQADLGGLINKFAKGQDVNIFENWRESVNWVKQRKAALDAGTIVGYPFGVPTLDDELGGIQAPDLVTILARQGEYKTWLSLYFAVQAMVAGAKVMYVSLEMSREQLGYRIHTLLSAILSKQDPEQYPTVFRNTELMKGTVDVTQYTRFLRRAARLVKKGFVIPEARDAGSVGQFQAKLEEHKPDVAFYDYFGLSIGDSKVENWVAAADMSRGFKQLSTQYNIPIILNAQANRSAAESKEAPRLDQIALTDSLGRDSDRVLSLRLNKGQLSMYVAKNRFGAMGQRLRFDLDIDIGMIDEVVARHNRMARYADEEE